MTCEVCGSKESKEYLHCFPADNDYDLEGYEETQELCDSCLEKAQDKCEEEGWTESWLDKTELSKEETDIDIQIETKINEEIKKHFETLDEDD